MTDPTRTPRLWLLAPLACVALLLAATPAAASPPLGVFSKVEESNGNLFEWSAPFSLFRWAILAALLVVSWFTAFNVLMLSWLAVENRNPPRPKDAFARAAGWFVLFAAVSFDLVFAVVANDLYRKPWVKWFPSPLTPLNYHILWIGVLALGIVLKFVVRFGLRR